jgi:NAD(P)-dependent dehydrogenase (short-subunit alcohol dehydrogenase family)
MNIDFSGSVVLVAGGTGGLGRAVTMAFLEEGAKVVVTFRKQEEYVALKSVAGAKGASLEGHLVDVTDELAVGQLVDRISTNSEGWMRWGIRSVVMQEASGYGSWRPGFLIRCWHSIFVGVTPCRMQSYRSCLSKSVVRS